MATDLPIQTNAALAPFTTLKIGGPAKWLLHATNGDQIAAGIRWAKEQQIRVGILGGGSNTLVADHGFDGLVIIPKNDQVELVSSELIVGAGATIGQLIAGALKHNLGGLSWLIGVPGSVGGAIYGNAGTGSGAVPVQAIGQYVSWVDTLLLDGTARRWNREACGFAYRHSSFKNQDLVIVRVGLVLPHVDPAQERQVLANAAKQKQTNQPLAAASAGCMFKNPAVERERLPVELQTHVYENGTISAWRLIQQVDLQGYQLGQVQISPHHANFMINLGGATADQVVQLLSLVKQRVRDTLGIQLTEEVQYLGF